MRMLRALPILTIAAISVSGVAVATESTRAVTHSAAVEELLPALKTSQTHADLVGLKGSPLVVNTDVIRESIRYVGKSDVGHHWVGVDSRRNICLVSMVDGPDDIGGVVCNPGASYYQHGISLGVAGDDSGLTAHLLPPDVETVSAEREIAALERQLPSQAPVDLLARSGVRVLVTGADEAQSVGRLAMTRSDGRVYEIPSVARP